MTEEITLIDNIKSLYSKVKGKGKFIKDLAEEFKKSPRTIRNHWFSEYGFWSVPEEYKGRVIELLQNKILEQNLKKSA